MSTKIHYVLNIRKIKIKRFEFKMLQNSTPKREMEKKGAEAGIKNMKGVLIIVIMNICLRAKIYTR